jgi:hypothetical protein
MKKIGLNILGMFLISLLIITLTEFREIDFLSQSGWGYLIGCAFVPVAIAVGLGVFLIALVWIIKRKIWYTSIIVMWIVFAISVALSLYGEYAMQRDELKIKKHVFIHNDEDIQKISNDYVEFMIPQHWEYKYSALRPGQLYNIICYSNNGVFRISAERNENKFTPNDYYWNFKNTIYKEIINQADTFIITEEKSAKIFGYDAYISEYRSAIDNIAFLGRTIIFNQGQKQVMISLASQAENLDTEFGNVLKSLSFK